VIAGRKLRARASLREVINAAKLLMPLEVLIIEPLWPRSSPRIRCSCGHWHSDVQRRQPNAACAGYVGELPCVCARVVPAWAKKLKLRRNPARQWPPNVMRTKPWPK
jgi:hypothetical protein